MNGKFKGINRAAEFFCVMVFFTIMPCFGVYFRNEGAMWAFEIIVITIGCVLTAYSANLPCYYAADEKSLTIKTGRTEHRYPLNKIKNISCEYINGESVTTVVKLTVTTTGGETKSFLESSKTTTTELLNDPDGSKKPQLMILCDYVKQLKGAAV